MIKKLLSLTLALAAVLTLAACRGNEINDAPPLYSVGSVEKLAEAGAFSEELEELDGDTAFALYKLANALVKQLQHTVLLLVANDYEAAAIDAYHSKS